jgi:predicted 3-demethylubiquinone-9 3-methyltransferase (glyoxalase superfamily)
MSHSIYPCLWFDGQAGEAARYYCSIFRDARLLEENPVVSRFEIGGLRFMALNGGPQYAPNPALSFFIYTGSQEEINRFYASLSVGGKVIMPLGRYDWSACYAWIEDRYGVSWQLDIDDIRSAQKVVPNLLFVNEKKGLVKAALDRYTHIFPHSISLLEAPYPPGADVPEGALLFAQCRLKNSIVNAMSSTLAHDYDFSPGTSLVVECQDQTEIDYYWEALGQDGEYQPCGWLKDAFGVSWQVVPAALSRLMSDPERGARAMQALLSMTKLDIAALENA